MHSLVVTIPIALAEERERADFAHVWFNVRMLEIFYGQKMNEVEAPENQPFSRDVPEALSGETLSCIPFACR